MSELLTRRRFTVDEYHRMGEAGILPEDNRLDLIAGDIVFREPIGIQHASTVDRLNRLWTSRLGDRAIVRIQNPVTFPRLDSELQPDVMLLRPREDFYATGHPKAADVLLLIEVAGTSLRLDRRVKIPLYARAWVREVWLVDLTTAQLEICREPLGDSYRNVRVLTRGERVFPEAFSDLTIESAISSADAVDVPAAARRPPDRRARARRTTPTTAFDGPPSASVSESGATQAEGRMPGRESGSASPALRVHPTGLG